MYYLKYILKKTDGSEIDPEADYFVLRIDKDPVAILAAEVYAQNTPDKDLAAAMLNRIAGHKARIAEKATL